jgi:hypothetical protein
MDRYKALDSLRGGMKGIREWNSRRDQGEDIPKLKRALLEGARLVGANSPREHDRVLYLSS